MNGGMNGMRTLCNQHANALCNPTGGALASYMARRKRMTLHLAASNDSLRHREQRRGKRAKARSKRT
jgi:hypothetical protein